MLLYSHPSFRQHDTKKHPECIARIEKLDAALESVQLSGAAHWIEKVARWPQATLEEMSRIHEPDYLAQLKKWCETDAGQIEADTFVSPGTWPAALMGAGAALDATRRVVEGQSLTAFCAMRPPGHHAVPKGPMGFCVVNNIAVAAAQAIAMGVRSVLIVDFDVHHGNGTQDAFYENEQVAFFSIHRSPFYPGTGSADETGTGKGLGTTMNVPVTAGILKRQFFEEFERKLTQFAAKIKPELVLVSAGFDAHRLDPVGGLCLEAEDFTEVTEVVQSIAQEHAGGKLVSLLEGGYHLEHMPASALCHVRALAETQL